MKLNRTVLSYGYFAGMAACTVAINLNRWTYSDNHPDDILLVLYLMVAVLMLSLVEVRIERGRLSLSALAIGASSLLLNPRNATLIGLAIAFGFGRRGLWRIFGNAIVTATFACVGATVVSFLNGPHNLSLGLRIFVLLIVNAGNLAAVATGLSLRTGESVRSIIQHNFTSYFYFAFGYFVLAATLISYLLDGSLIGYVLTAIACVLAIALTDTIAGRRVRRVLESELSDADRHLFHSRAVEGVVHNLRNHVATAVGYLKEIDLHRLDPVDREAVETATAAANDAVTVLRSLSQGATPRVSYATEPVDLNELVSRAIGMARPRARSKEIQLAVRESAEEVKVRADPLLLREVITNLVNNAVDAAPPNGRVELSTGRRSNGWPYFTVADNGPGVSDDHRHHLFEPHFTTKEGGTGLGLFMSYGVVREHQGDIVYSGSIRGAVFTVVLPPFRG